MLSQEEIKNMTKLILEAKDQALEKISETEKQNV
jgi:hypothetical protein